MVVSSNYYSRQIEFIKSEATPVTHEHDKSKAGFRGER